MGKQEMIDKITDSLKQRGDQLQQNKERLTNMQVAEELDVLIDTLHFLQDYDENVKVLNEYWLKKRQEEKYRNTTGFDHEDK